VCKRTDQKRERNRRRAARESDSRAARGVRALDPTPYPARTARRRRRASSESRPLPATSVATPPGSGSSITCDAIVCGAAIPVAIEAQRQTGRIAQPEQLGRPLLCHRHMHFVDARVGIVEIEDRLHLDQLTIGRIHHLDGIAEVVHERPLGGSLLNSMGICP